MSVFFTFFLRFLKDRLICHGIVLIILVFSTSRRSESSTFLVSLNEFPFTRAP